MSARVVIVGSGPSGIGAAITAADLGLDVTVIDAFDAPGGQVFRSLPAAFRPTRRQPGDYVLGESLRHRFSAAPLRYLPRTRVWHVGHDLVVEAAGPRGASRHPADVLILATGAIERVVPFEGWTLPGVVGLAAATILLKSDRMTPGETVVVAGRGPLLAAVAADCVKIGARVAAVVDANGPSDWLAVAPRLLARPDQFGRGLGWIAALRRAGVPVLFRHRLQRVESRDHQLVVEVTPVGRELGDTRRFACDAVAVGDGLVPDVALSRLLGLVHRGDRLRGGLVPDVDAAGRASRRKVYVTGDAAGIAGAAAAFERGRITGLAVAQDLGLAPLGGQRATLAAARTRLTAADIFAGASRRLMAVSEADYRHLAPSTLVCRCEDVSVAEINAAIEDGAGDLDQVKAWTRCGMGPCQGRFCGATVAALAARQLGPMPSESGSFTPRPPVRPVAIADLIGRGDGAAA